MRRAAAALGRIAGLLAHGRRIRRRHGVSAHRFSHKLARVSDTKPCSRRCARQLMPHGGRIDGSQNRQPTAICPHQCAGLAAARGLDEERTTRLSCRRPSSAFSSCRGTCLSDMPGRARHHQDAEGRPQGAVECALCSRSFELSLDEMVEVVFTVSPRVRKIAAHDPHTLPFWDYYRQMFWSSAVDLSDEELEKADRGLHARCA